MTFTESLQIERIAGIARQRHLVDPSLTLVFGQKTGCSGGFRTVDRRRHFFLVALTHRVVLQIVGSGKALGAADRPGDRRGVQRKFLLDLVENFVRIAAFAIHLVDEGNDRNIAHAANFEELERARFDTLGGIDDHDRAVDGGQRAVGIVGEVLVAGRIKQIEDAILVLEGHDRSDHRNAAIALDIHPVGARLDTVLLGLDLTRKLDRSAEQQQLFGQCGFTGVGMRDDREGTALGDRMVGRRHREGSNSIRKGCAPSISRRLCSRWLIARRCARYGVRRVLCANNAPFISCELTMAAVW